MGGYHLPKGTWVHIDIWGVHHDAKYWPQPDVFRPERFLSGAAEAEGRHPNAFLAFGLGALIHLTLALRWPVPARHGRCMEAKIVCLGERTCVWSHVLWGCALGSRWVGQTCTALRVCDSSTGATQTSAVTNIVPLAQGRACASATSSRCRRR